MNSKYSHFLHRQSSVMPQKKRNGLLCLLIFAGSLTMTMILGMPSANIRAEANDPTEISDEVEELDLELEDLELDDLELEEEESKEDAKEEAAEDEEVSDDVEEIDLGDLNEDEEVSDDVEEVDLGDLNEDEEVSDDVEEIDLGDLNEDEEVSDDVEEVDLGDLNEDEEVSDDVEEIDLGDLNEDEEAAEEEAAEEEAADGKETKKASGSGFSWGGALWGNGKNSKKDETSEEKPTDAADLADPKEAGSDADAGTAENSAKSSTKKTPSAEYPLENLIPEDAAVIVRISSVREFNAKLEKLTETNFLRMLKSLGKGEYAKQLEPDRPVGIVLFPVKGAFQWAAFIPVKRYRKFVELLGADVSELPETIPDGTVSMLSPTLCAVPYCGHAVLAPNPMLLTYIQRSPKFSVTRTFTPCAVKDPTVSIELTNSLIQWLTRRGRIGLEEFAPVFGPEMAKLQENSEQMALAQQYFDRINASISWLDANIESARIDLTVGETESILSTAFLPKAETRLAGLLQDPFVPQISASLESKNFLKVVPAYPASLIGQVDLPPATAERLKAPFNRIRHVEYALITPPENGSLAEGWCFFLEVDDAEAFVRETILPQAEEIGTKLGANTLGELGSEALQRNAERRLDRQMNRRRPPRRYADPEKASERGQALGSLIGGLVGKAVASKEALKKQDLMGFDLYVSDLVQFTQLKKLIRQQEEGTAPPASSMFQNADPGQMVGKLIDGIISGEANLDLQEMMGGGMNGSVGNLAETSTNETADELPLAATRNFMVVLDPQHLLVVPGNDAVLFDAVRLWNFARDKYLPPVPPKTPEELAARRNIPPYLPNYQSLPPEPPREENSRWHESWQNICESIEFPGRHHVRFASVLSTEETMRTLEFASRVYGFEIPQNVRESIPVDLSPILSVYTTTGNAGNTFTTLPHEMSRSQFQRLITNLPLLLAK